jgi:hypothetical protein
MDGLLTYLIGVLAFNVAAALAAFGIVFWSRRRELELTPARGLAVLVVGWLGGSLIVIALQVLFTYGGFNYREGSLELIVSLCVLSAVMYPLFSWLCPKPPALPTNSSGNETQGN